jgi:hypothetical protein
VTEVWTGGCQCGAVRYRFKQKPKGAHICHCRMCQKAFGSYFAPLTSVPLDQFEVTRGALALFKSSDPVERGFYQDCGTPLTIYTIGDEHIFVSIGSLDEPEKVAPEKQFGNEAKLTWFEALPSLPGSTTTEEAEPDLASKIAASNHQHPDHDTLEWPPRSAT